MSKDTVCPTCGGYGAVNAVDGKPHIPYSYRDGEKCPTCNGTGRVTNSPEEPARGFATATDEPQRPILEATPTPRQIREADNQRNEQLATPTPEVHHGPVYTPTGVIYGNYTDKPHEHWPGDPSLCEVCNPSLEAIEVAELLDEANPPAPQAQPASGERQELYNMLNTHFPFDCPGNRQNPCPVVKRIEEMLATARTEARREAYEVAWGVAANAGPIWGMDTHEAKVFKAAAWRLEALAHGDEQAAAARLDDLKELDGGE